MRRALLVGLLLMYAGCGGQSPSEQVDAYVKSANAAQASAARPFADANRTYARFLKHKLDDPGAVSGLGAAEAAIRRTQARLARIPAPPPARTLRTKLLHLYQLNADLAHETVLLARYLPARQQALEDVTHANQKLAKGLKRAKQPPAQAAVLTDYRRGLNAALATLRKLKPPPVASAIHHTQIKRLAASRKLAGQLRAAVRERDAKRTAKLVIAFRAVGEVATGEQALQARDVDAYAARRETITHAAADVKRERARLERAR